MWTNEPLSGTKDGTNTDFTFPFVLGTDAGGRPAGVLNFRNSRTLYTVTDPPPPGYWTQIGPSTIRVAVSDAPLAGDILQWDWAMQA